MESAKLSVWDYVIFAIMLALSSAIGIYHGCKRKQQTTREYLTAGGSMHWFPISVSLLATFISAIALMGLSAEVYTFGIQHILTIFAYAVMMLISAWIYAPIFYRTKVTSANEYLEKRFGVFVRMIGCFLFILQYIVYLSVAVFAPSLALQAVAGVPLAASIISTGVVCTFYTTLGGMRGVVWTDVLQAFIMILGVVVVIIVGSNEVGGISNVLKEAKKGERLVLFDFNPDPTVRNTFWGLTFGVGLTMISNWTTSQPVVQRFLSASSLRNVKISLYLNIFFMFSVISCCSFAGLVMYAVYGQCDPKTTGHTKSNDQIIPYFVVNKLSHLPGVPGLYTACLFSGALSSISSGLNSLTAVTVEDIVKRIRPRMTEAKATIVSKIIACMYGIVVISMAFLVSGVGTMILQLGYCISGVIGAPCFAMFTLGMLVPKANSKGVSCGLFVGWLLSAWIGMGAIVYPPDKRPLPVSEYKCPSFNGTEAEGKVPYHFKGYDFPLAKLYSLSPYWYGWVGAGTTFLVGWIVSLIFHNENEKADPSLLFDCKKELKSLIPKKFRKTESNDTYDVDKQFDDLEHKNMDLNETEKLASGGTSEGKELEESL